LEVVPVNSEESEEEGIRELVTKKRSKKLVAKKVSKKLVAKMS
jgi:hypothetical protein